jgi:1-deoxy-D-xylulose-5-phosphate synthase
MMEGPLLVHVLTTKGKGYEPAEKDPSYYHGVGEFEVETGRKAGKPKSAPSYTNVFGQTLVELAQKNDSIFAITAAMPEGTGLKPFEEAMPERFMDVGIAEQHAVTCAAGMATQGIIPVVAIYSTFLQRAYDQVIHDVCLQNLHVVFALDRGGIVGQDGVTHQGQFDLSYLRIIPHLVVMAPKDENELRHMIVTAINHDGPIALRYPRGQGVGVPLEEPITPISIGEAEQLSEGGDLTVIAIGNMVWPAVRAAEQARAQGVNVSVINLRFIKPLDARLLERVLSSSEKILTVEENVLQGGMGSAILEFMESAQITGKSIRRLGIPDEFVEHGAQSILRNKYGLDEEAIYKEILEMTGGGHRSQRTSRQAAGS